jgi:hypothetical protein
VGSFRAQAKEAAHLIPVRIAIIKKIKNAGEDSVKKKLLYILDGNEN